MAELPTPLQGQVLDVIVATQEPLSLADIATAIGRTKGPAHRLVQQLVEAGWVERLGHGPDVRYRPRPTLAVDVLERHPWGHDDEPTWVRRTWTVSDQPDWRFPLVGQVRDAEARLVLLRFLDALWRNGLFTPWLSDRETYDETASVAIFAYGSCVRGDAREGSDLDLVAVLPKDAETPQASPLATRMGKLAADISTDASRFIDLHCTFITEPRGVGFELPWLLQRNIVHEAVTVYSTDPTGRLYIESWRAHEARWGKMLDDRGMA